MKTKIHNMKSLNEEINRLKQLNKDQVLLIQDSFHDLALSLNPVHLVKEKAKDLFSSGERKTAVASSGLGYLAGFILEKVFLRKSNFILRYAVSQLGMNLVSRLASDKKFTSGISDKIKSSGLFNKIMGFFNGPDEYNNKDKNDLDNDKTLTII